MLTTDSRFKVGRHRTATPLAIRQFIFWSQVAPNLLTGCWLWTGHSLGQGGYGIFVLKGRNVLAHRLAYTWEVGEIPAGLDILHSCDTRLCVNPAHLAPGTHRENMLDMEAKGRGRHASGERHWKATLSDEQVGEIRERLRVRRHGDQARLAREYGVCQNTISFIRARKTRAI